MRCVRAFRSSEADVTIPDPGDILDPRIDVERIAAYDVAGVPAPANLAEGQPLPVRKVDTIRVKQADGSWLAL